MRKIAALSIVGLAALGLTACAAQDPNTPTEAPTGDAYIEYQQVVTPSGTVPCLVYVGYKQGGLSCDWDALP